MIRRGAPRGQATVELALGSVLFVTVLLVGIFFAETGFLSLKTQEAASFAAYDASGRRVHKFTQNNLQGNKNGAWGYMDKPEGMSGVGQEATTRYADFDGVRDQGGAELAQVVTRGENLTVTCERDPSMAFGLPRPPSGKPGGRQFMADVEDDLGGLYRSQGGLRCTSSATASAFRLPQRFMDGNDGVLSKSSLLDRRSITLCGVGRAKNGTCDKHYSVLTGDWSFDAEPGSSLNHDSRQDRSGNPIGPANPAYRQLVKELYLANGDSAQGGGGFTAAQRLVQRGGGIAANTVATQYDDRKFLMSYSGVEHGYSQTAGGGSRPVYNTSGVYLPAFFSTPSMPSVRSVPYASCFLGLAREGCR